MLENVDLNAVNTDVNRAFSSRLIKPKRRHLIIVDKLLMVKIIIHAFTAGFF